MIKVQNIFNFSFTKSESTVEEQKRLKLDQAIQTFATSIHASLDSEKSIKNFIYPDYTASPLFRVDKADETHAAVEEFLSARSEYLVAVSSWAERKLPEADLSEHVEFARASLRQIDPNLVGEQRYNETDCCLVKLAKWVFYSLAHTFTSEAKIETRCRRFEVLESRHSLERDRKQAVEHFHQEMKDFLSESPPSTLPEIAQFFQMQYADVSPEQLSQNLSQIKAFQEAKVAYFEKIAELDHSFDEIFGRSPMRADIEEVEEVETSNLEESVEETVELADRTIYKGSVAEEQVKKVVIEALGALGNREIATFVSEHLIPTGVKEFVLYKNEKKGEIHFEGPKEAHIKSEKIERKYVVNQKLVFTFNNAGNITFENGGYRIGAVSRDLERHLDKLPRLMRGAASAALGEYLTKGLRISIDLTGMTQTKEGIRLHLSPINGEREIPMEGGVPPSGLIGNLIQKFTKHDDVTFEGMKESYTDLAWK